VVSISDEPGESELERKARALFEDSVERLDAQTRTKLTQARNRALDEVSKGAVRRRWIWAPAGAVAIAAIIAVALSSRGPHPSPEAGALALDDIDIVADSENFEMLEDVEFYMWLEDAAPDGHSG
jgi:hypothetical protein